jgi:hypothetical protein
MLKLGENWNKRSRIVRIFGLYFFDVWDILGTEQSSSEEWHIAIWSGSCPDLMGENYGHVILRAMYSEYKKVYIFKLL